MLNRIVEIEMIICIKWDLNKAKMRTYAELICLN